MIKSPIIRLRYDFRLGANDLWRFGYSASDKSYISIWKNGIERKARVIDVGIVDDTMVHDTTVNPIRITGGVEALYDDWYNALVTESASSFDVVLATNEIINLYERLGNDKDE